MLYDPIKNKILSLVKTAPFLRKLFFFSLDRLLLRQMYVKNSIKSLYLSDYTLMLYDAGSGFCQYSDFVLSRWKKSEVFALDLKTDYLIDYNSYAISNYGNRFKYIAGDLTEYVTEEKYNLILAIDILEHIEDDIKVLQNFYQSLSLGGKLIVSSPSDTDEAAKFTSEHVRPGYSMDDIKMKLLKAGFRVIESKHSYGHWGKLSWLLSMKTPLSMLSLSKLFFVLLPIYYLIMYPLIYVLMIADYHTNNKQGTGIIIIAEKAPISS